MLIGAVVFSVIGYVSLKTSKTSKVAENLMIRPNDHWDSVKEGDVALRRDHTIWQTS